MIGKHNTVEYPESMRRWLADAPEMPMGPGVASKASGGLVGETWKTLFGNLPVADEAMARSCHAGLLLRHNRLDASHTVSQSIENPTGSFWHGIMHRREPDYGNAAYWFRKVGEHPVFAEIGAAAQEIVRDANVDQSKLPFLQPPQHWDPYGFIDFCESVASRGDAQEKLAISLQLREWELLFAYSYRHALGTA